LDLRVFAGAIRLAFDPTFPGRDYSKRQVPFGDGQKGNAPRSTGYPAAVARSLFVIEDDLLFAQRARAAAGRLGIPVQGISPGDARSRAWGADQVVILQATLRPEQQLELVDHLTHLPAAPVVVAVTGHLETELRQRLKARGATLAAHSAMDRVLARAMGLSGGDADVRSHRRS
jgi:CheY-like chemotaxis protein